MGTGGLSLAQEEMIKYAGVFKNCYLHSLALRFFEDLST